MSMAICVSLILSPPVVIKFAESGKLQRVESEDAVVGSGFSRKQIGNYTGYLKRFPI